MSVRVFSQPPNDGVTIGTHDGHFHCDEALACALLHMTEEFKDANICRTRNKEYLALCNIVVDVGAEYIPEKYRFDHHQLSFTGTLTTTENAYKTKLSSAGLVYKHYGREIVAKLCGGLPESDVDVIYDRVYKNFIEHIDGIDNGVEETSLSSTDSDVTLVQNYRVTTTLSARAGKFNPSWNDDKSSDMENECFKKAMKLTGDEFVECVTGYVKSWMPARSIVQRAVDERHSVHDSGRILKLACPCPWQEHLFDIEAKAKIEGEIYFVLYPEGKGPWRVQCVGVKGTKFQNRKSLEWKGLRDDECSAASGIPDCIFVHASGFIGGNKTEAGAMAMASKSLAA